MKKALCIFVSKNSKPDLYINIIGYTLAKYQTENIARVFLISVFDFPFDRKKERKRLEKIKSNILKQLHSLMNKKYLSWNQHEDEFSGEKIAGIEFDPDFKSIYEEVLALCSDSNIMRTKEILFGAVSAELKLLLHQHFGEYIFDISGLLKRYMAEISLFLTENDYPYFAFEMVHKLKHNEEDLIHKLKNEDFNYLELTSKNYRVIYKDSQNTYDGRKNLFNKMGLVDIWKRKLKQAKTEEVISDLDDFLFDKEEHDLKSEVDLVSAKLNTLQKKNLEGTIQLDDYMRNLNIIRNNIQVIISKINKKFEI